MGLEEQPEQEGREEQHEYERQDEGPEDHQGQRCVRCRGRKASPGSWNVRRRGRKAYPGPLCVGGSVNGVLETCLKCVTLARRYADNAKLTKNYDSKQHHKSD